MFFEPSKNASLPEHSILVAFTRPLATVKTESNASNLTF